MQTFCWACLSQGTEENFLKLMTLCFRACFFSNCIYFRCIFFNRTTDWYSSRHSWESFRSMFFRTFISLCNFNFLSWARGVLCDSCSCAHQVEVSIFRIFLDYLVRLSSLLFFRSYIISLVPTHLMWTEIIRRRRKNRCQASMNFPLFPSTADFGDIYFSDLLCYFVMLLRILKRKFSHVFKIFSSKGRMYFPFSQLLKCHHAYKMSVFFANDGNYLQRLKKVAEGRRSDLDFHSASFLTLSSSLT